MGILFVFRKLPFLSCIALCFGDWGASNGISLFLFGYEILLQ